jgi:hypothetical protein
VGFPFGLSLKEQLTFVTDAAGTSSRFSSRSVADWSAEWTRIQPAGVT